LGLRYIDLIGVFIAAKRQGLITEIKPYLEALRNMAGFRIEEALYTRVLKDKGE